MQSLKEQLKIEAEDLREMGKRLLNGDISVPQFKGYSGGMGVYAQRGAKKFMIRLRTHSGVVSHTHLRLILRYAKQYHLEKIHLTTRQAIQLHDLDIDAICDIMKNAIDYDLFTKGGGGNYPRNVALSPLSGVERGELFDVTPFALMTGKYFQERVQDYHLPRKLKVAFSNSDQDTACATFNDMGFIASKEGENPKFRLFLAGGMGGGSALGIEYGRLIDPKEVLYHIEAMTRLFIAEGDYQNKAKARTRFIPRRMGKEAFLDCYEKYLIQVKEEFKMEEREVELSKEEEWSSELTNDNCIIPQKQKGLYTFILHFSCGQVPVTEWEKIDGFLEENPQAEVRLSMNEDMMLRNLTKENIEQVKERFCETIANTRLGMSVSCVGVPTCQMGILQSQLLCKQILEKAEQKQVNQNYLPAVHISGCPNSCTRHQVSCLGFAGRKKMIDQVLEEVYDVYAGGKIGVGKTQMGKLYGIMKIADIPEFVASVGQKLQEEKIPFEDWIELREEEMEKLAAPFLLK